MDVYVDPLVLEMSETTSWPFPCHCVSHFKTAAAFSQILSVVSMHVSFFFCVTLLLCQNVVTEGTAAQEATLPSSITELHPALGKKKKICQT